MKSDFNKDRRDLLKSVPTMVGAAALVSMSGVSALAVTGTQATEAAQIPASPTAQPERVSLHKYVIEREIPGAGKLTAEQLKGISQKSCGILQEMGPDIQWVESYVTDDKVYCIYLAPNEDMIREHAKKGGFPANRISMVRTMIDPTTAG